MLRSALNRLQLRSTGGAIRRAATSRVVRPSVFSAVPRISTSPIAMPPARAFSSSDSSNEKLRPMEVRVFSFYAPRLVYRLVLVLFFLLFLFSLKHSLTLCSVVTCHFLFSSNRLR